MGIRSGRMLRLFGMAALAVLCRTLCAAAAHTLLRVPTGGSEVSFDRAQFSRGEVSFPGAQFSGGQVDFSHVDDWPHQPMFGWAPGMPPPKACCCRRNRVAQRPDISDLGSQPSEARACGLCVSRQHVRRRDDRFVQIAPEWGRQFSAAARPPPQRTPAACTRERHTAPTRTHGRWRCVSLTVTQSGCVSFL